MSGYKPRRTYDKEFKREAVRLALEWVEVPLRWNSTSALDEASSTAGCSRCKKIHPSVMPGKFNQKKEFNPRRTVLWEMEQLSAICRLFIGGSEFDPGNSLILRMDNLLLAMANSSSGF